MKVNDLRPEDFPAVESLHASQGLDYRLPDLASPLLVVKKAVVNEQGEVIGACLLRLTAETMLILDPKLTPPEKMDAMEAMQPEVLASAWRLGLDEVECRIPEAVEQIFTKRLHTLGWTRDRDGWAPWSRSTCDLP
ncbi:MAG: hypothetical protein RB191_24485 [Terriglobia bacterium]|nr:hypothetical protein [Terriglobia bacterium]